MTQRQLQTVFLNPDQARAAIAGQIAPMCRQMWEIDPKMRLRVTVEPEEDSKSTRQRGFYHGVVLTEIAEQAKANGQQFPMQVWKEYFRDKFLGYTIKSFLNPMTGKKELRRERVSTEGLSVRAYSTLIEQVLAIGATELGVRFSESNWEGYRGNAH